MHRFTDWLSIVVLCLAAGFSGASAHGQSSLPYSTLSEFAGLGTDLSNLPEDTSSPQPAAAGPTSVPPRAVPHRRPPQMLGHARNALRFYGGRTTDNTLARFPRRPSLSQRAAAPAQAAPANKPFAGASHRPTVSPYLNLYRDEIEEAAPNYFAFVRPALQQQDENRHQQSEIQRLQRQTQRPAATTAAPNSAPAVGQSAKYLDTTHYYSGLAK